LRKDPDLKNFKEEKMKKKKQLEHKNQFSDDVQDNGDNCQNDIYDNDDPVLQQPELDKTLQEQRPATVMEEETLNCVIGEKEMPIHDSSSEESNSSSEDSNYKINMSDKRNRKPKLGQFVNPVDISSSSSFFEISFEENIVEHINKCMEEYNRQCTKSQEEKLSLESVRNKNGILFMKTN
jgi:hypothetical protein